MALTPSTMLELGKNKTAVTITCHRRFAVV